MVSKNRRAYWVSSFAFLTVLGAAALSGATGCGDSSGTSTTQTTGGGGEGGSTTVEACKDVDITGCSIALGPTEDDTDTVQTALIEAKSGDTVCMCPGTYKFQSRVSLNVPNVTVKGVGAAPTDVVFDFKDQMAGDDGFTVSSDGFTIENLSVKNTPGNGIVVSKASNVVFRKLKVSWDAGSVKENGAYAVYPVQCDNVLIEDSEIVGAADAGVYVGQSKHAIVRNNDVHGNVAGIEIENCTDSEVYGNKAYDNAAGILVFNLPNLEKKDGLRANVHDNESYDNNRENFAVMGSIVAAVPAGVGILLLAADETEIHDNDIHGNKSVAVVIVSFETLKYLVSDTTPDPGTDPDPESTYIYNNKFDGNGTDADPPFDLLDLDQIEDVVWDGVEKEPGSAKLCLGQTPPTFRNFNGVPNITKPENQSTDATPFKCDLTKQSPLD